MDNSYLDSLIAQQNQTSALANQMLELDSIGVMLSASAWSNIVLLIPMIIFNKQVAEILGRKGGGFMAKTIKYSIYGVIISSVMLPAVALYLGAKLGVAGILSILLLIAFIQIFAKSSGIASGKKYMSDLLGIAGSDRISDIQERLLESKLRLKSKVEVIKSIAENAKKESVQKATEEEKKKKLAEEKEKALKEKLNRPEVQAAINNPDFFENDKKKW